MTATQLKDYRSLRHLSQRALAELLDVHVMTVSRWERSVVKIPRAVEMALDQREGKTK
jgi:transcriptional regulator with XRE-family HTH domain